MNKKEILIGLFIALIFGGVFSLFASSWPDGLESVAEHKGFLALSESDPLMRAPVADYAWPGIKSEKMATATAGVFGVLVVFGAGYIVAFVLRRTGKLLKQA